MTIQRIENGPRFCRVLSHNGVVYLAGMTADDTSNGVIQQTRDTLAKIDHFLAKAGSEKQNYSPRSFGYVIFQTSIA